MCCPNIKPYVERFQPVGGFSGDPNNPYYTSRLTGKWKAVVIGPRSQFDRAYILSPSSIVGPPNDPTAFQRMFHSDVESNIHLVSVERPFVGEIDGPIIVAPAFWEETKGASPAARSTASTTTLLQRPLGGYLDLVFYRDVPPVIPTKRAPFSYCNRWENFGTTGVSLDTVDLPGWGRRMVSVSLEITGYTAGTLTWSFRGTNLVQNNNLSSGIIIAQDLQATTPISANSQQVFFFDGEFDNYTFVVTETVALGAGTTVDLIVKMWD